MRAFWCLAVTLLVLGLATTVAADEGLMKELEALGDKVEKAIVEDDVDTMLGMYVEDAISLPNFSPRMDGIEAFRAQHEAMASAGVKIHSFESQPTEAWECGDQVIEIGTYTISIDMPGAPETMDDKGKYLTIWQRGEDGSLKIKVETWNTDMDPMAMMGGSEGHEHEHMHEEDGDHGHGR